MSKYTPRKNRTGGFDFQGITWVRDHVRSISRDERLVLQYLASRCNTNHECWPKQSLIAADLECSQRHVWGLLKSLTEKGLINGIRRRTSSTIYTLQIQDSQTGAKPGLANSCESGLANLCIISNQSEVTNQSEVEGTSYRSAPSASAEGIACKTEKQTRREKAETLCRNYAQACPSSASAREAFWHELGRLYFPDSPQFFPDHNLTHLQRKTMTRLFEDMPTKACYVIAHVMATWPTDGKRTTPSLSTIDEYSSTDLHQSWKQANDHETKKAMLKRVSAKIQAIESAQVTA